MCISRCKGVGAVLINLYPDVVLSLGEEDVELRDFEDGAEDAENEDEVGVGYWEGVGGWF